jgi:hypothetical protein
MLLSDWLWHGSLPLAGDATLLAASVMLRQEPAAALFALGGVSLFLLFIGIHNAWDAAAYTAAHLRRP